MDQASPAEHMWMQMNDLEARIGQVRIDPSAEHDREIDDLKRRVTELEDQIKQMDAIMLALYKEVFNEGSVS